MRHLENIVRLVDTLHRNPLFHALVIQSPPGWAKSTTIDQALERLKLDFHAVGSYTTPLNLYNVLCEHPSKIIVLDDCAGLFGDAKSMSILKSATWTGAGASGDRRVTWGTTSDKALQESVIFTGKLILLTNVIPTGKETEAFLSRTLPYRIQFSVKEIQELLLEAAQSKTHFPDTALASAVASFLSDSIAGSKQVPAISLRTLHMGYQVAQTNPDSWRELLQTMIPQSTTSPEELVQKLATDYENIKEQQERFQHLTGLSRRTFFNYRKKIGLTGIQDGR